VTDNGSAPHSRLEISGALVLALCGFASTWCSCQAALWSGQQSTAYNAAGNIRTQAAQEATEGAQLAQVDVSLFVAWLQATAAHQEQLASFVMGRFRPEFQPAFAEWITQQPLKNPDAAPTPFTLKSYRVARRDHAARLSAEADRRTDEGEHANRESDRYVRGTVVFALALFFSGVVQTFRRPWVKVVLQGLSALLLIIGILVVAFLESPK
jgi:hypothetical protein